MPISIFKTAPRANAKIDIAEAFNIFNLLSARQASIVGHQFYINYVHDRDFVLILNSHIKGWQEQVSELEKQAEKYNLKTPGRSPVTIKFTAHTDDISDSLIFDLILNELTAELYALSRAVVSSTTNDTLHDIMTKHMLSHMKHYELLYKYGNLKGWMHIVPSYKTDKMLAKEPITVAEANNIWDHLIERYDQWQLTQNYLSIAHDNDFKAVLLSGSVSLESQMKTLEKECEKFEIPLPDRPSKIQKFVVDPGVLEDKFLYRNILTGIQGSIGLHVRAAIETIRNDALRKMFMDYLKGELSTYKNYCKYGKAKGWLKVVPTYHVN